VALKKVVSEYSGFPCQLSFHRLPHTYLPSGAGTMVPLVAIVASGRSVTPPHELEERNRFRSPQRCCVGRDALYLHDTCISADQQLFKITKHESGDTYLPFHYLFLFLLFLHLKESRGEYHVIEFSGCRALSEWILVPHIDEALVGKRWGGRWQALGVWGVGVVNVVEEGGFGLKLWKGNYDL
jgi:hypothetical protein